MDGREQSSSDQLPSWLIKLAATNISNRLINDDQSVTKINQSSAFGRGHPPEGRDVTMLGRWSAVAVSVSSRQDVALRRRLYRLAFRWLSASGEDRFRRFDTSGRSRLEMVYRTLCQEGV